MSMKYKEVVKRPHTLRQLTGMRAEEFQEVVEKIRPGFESLFTIFLAREQRKLKRPFAD